MIDNINNIVITGGAGFIGSHLVEALSNKGFSITVIDNFSRGDKNTVMPYLNDIDLVETSILNEKKIERYIQKSDAIFHLSALSRVIPSIKNPKLCYQSNISGTEIIARLCSKYDKKIIFSSSREVYGNAKKLPVSELSPLIPENPYGASKLASEAIIRAYSRTHGLTYQILRLANVYGSQDFDRVIPTFIERGIQGQNIFIYGGEQIIDFVYIDDVINAFILCLQKKNDNEIVNIGSGSGTNLKSLAESIIEILSSNSKIIYKKKRRGEIDQFVADISYAKKVFGWTPETSLKTGLEKLIDLYPKPTISHY